MNLPTIIQLYAPLVGALTMVFALGMLWQRVRTLEALMSAHSSVKVEMATLAANMVALASKVTEMREDSNRALAEMNHIFRNRVMVDVHAFDPRRDL